MSTIKSPDWLTENLFSSTNNQTVTTPKLDFSGNPQTQPVNNSLLTTPQLPPPKVFTPWKAPEEKAFDANTDVAALRKQWKEELMAKGMKRRDAKNQATLLVNLRILALGNNASLSQKDWMNARAKLYTVDSNGNITRNKSNFWNIFGTIMGGLTLGPTGAVIANSTIPRHLNSTTTTNWGTSTLDSIKPSLEFLDAEARIKLAASQKTPVAQETPTAQATPTVNNPAETPVVAVKPPVVTQPSWIDNPDNAYAKRVYGFNSSQDVNSMQKILQAAGLYKGKLSGNWDHATRQAYENAKAAGLIRYGNLMAPWWYSLGKGNYNIDRNTYTINNYKNRGQAVAHYDPNTKKIVINLNIKIKKPRKSNKVNTKSIREQAEEFYSNPDNGYMMKQGGKFQQGGSMTQEDLQEQLLTAATLGMIGYANVNLKAMDFTTAVSQIMELALTKPETLQEIASNEELVKAGIEIMKQLEPEVLEMVSKPGGLRKILAQLKNKTKMAKQGSKLEYIQKLRGICPEGYEMSYMKAGGKVCPVCKKKSKKAQNGTKMLDNGMPVKKMGGAISDLMNEIKTSLFQKGGKTTQKVNWTDPADGSQFAFNDSTELKDYQNLIRQFRKDKTKMSKEQLDRLSELNKRMISSTNGD